VLEYVFLSLIPSLPFYLLELNSTIQSQFEAATIQRYETEVTSGIFEQELPLPPVHPTPYAGNEIEGQIEVLFGDDDDVVVMRIRLNFPEVDMDQVD